MRALLCLAIFCFGITPVFSGELRTWQAAVGAFKVDAELVSQTEALVVLKKGDGTELKVPKEKLSAADLKFLADLAKPASILPTTPTPDTPATNAPSSKTANDTAKVSNTWAKLTDPPVPDEAGTDYAALVKELMAIPPAPVFTKLNEMKLELPSPELAVLAEGGQHLCTHDVANNKLDIWDLNTGKITHTWNCGPLANPRCFAISPTGNFLAIGRDDHMVVTYNAQEGKKIYEHNMVKRQDKKLFRVALHWGEDRVYFLSQDTNVFWFPIGGGQGKGLEIKKLVTGLEDWASTNEEVELRVSPKGTAGINYNPMAYFTLLAEKTFPFPAGVQTQDKLLAATPIQRGMIRWDPYLAIKQLCGKGEKEQPSDPMVGRAGLVRTSGVRAGVDRAEKFAWCYGLSMDQQAVDIYSLDEFELPLTVAVPQPINRFRPQDREWISPEAKRIVRWCAADKQLTIYELSNFEPLPSWKIHGLCHRLLLEKKYDRLDALAAVLQKERTIPGGTGKPMLHEIIMGFHEQQFYVEPWEWEQRLEAWVKEQPKSALARLVLANHRVCEGWAARGSGAANSVTEAGWEKFRGMGEVGDKLIKPLFDQPEPPADAFFLQLRIAKMLSWDPEKQLELATQMIKVSPNHAPFHEEMVVNLLPRWYGAPGLSGKYAEKVAERLGAGPGDYLYARMGISLANYTQPQTFVEETGFDCKKILNALILELSQNPEDRHLQLRFHGFAIYARQAQPEIFDEEMVKAINKSTVGLQRLLRQLDWNPYAINQSKILQKVIQRSAVP